jgi:ketosteroid isomerase-like protein
MIGVMIAKMLARRSYDAINRGDVAGFMANWHRDATLTYPGDLSVSGTHKGTRAIESWFRHFKEAIPIRTFRPISISVKNVFDLVGNNVIAVQWDNRPVNRAGKEFYVRGVTVSTARWGKITESTTYVFDYQLLPELWGEEKAQGQVPPSP